MKYIYVVLMVGVLWCSEGYGEDKSGLLSQAIRDLTKVQFECIETVHDANIAYTDNKFIYLHQQITELKAEVEELRKMVEKKKGKDISGTIRPSYSQAYMSCGCVLYLNNINNQCSEINCICSCQD